MKRCSKCRTDYFDNMLEFCLEDGERLVQVSKTEEIGIETQTVAANPATAKTAQFPFSAPIGAHKNTTGGTPQPIISRGKALETKVKTKSFEVLSIAPVIISLLHNWVQWLYVSNQEYNSIGAFLISSNFVTWLLLLISGAVIGLLALKYCEKKRLAYVSLIMLAINLLLFLVPKR